MIATTPAPPTEIEELRLHRILVAVDGSENAELALAAAVTAARRDHATVTLLTVTPDLATEAGRWPAAPLPPAGQADIDAGAQRILREAVERMPADVSVTSLFRRGKAGPAIVAAAAGGNYDAVILGARGVGRVGSLLGSVSQHVLHHCDTAVFVAHAPRP